jgi:hypothetical protein
MVQAIDNLTRLSGSIVTRSAHPTLADYDLVTLQVSSAEPVPERADLLGRHVGGLLPVAVRRALIGNAAAGTRLMLRARVGVNGAIAEKDPAAEDFSMAAADSQ